MRLIPKIALYAAIILLLSISLDKKVETQAGPPKVEAVLTKSQTKVGVVPYDIIGKIRISNLVYKERIIMKPDFELSL